MRKLISVLIVVSLLLSCGAVIHAEENAAPVFSLDINDLNNSGGSGVSISGDTTLPVEEDDGISYVNLGKSKKIDISDFLSESDKKLSFETWLKFDNVTGTTFFNVSKSVNNADKSMLKFSTYAAAGINELRVSYNDNFTGRTIGRLQGFNDDFYGNWHHFAVVCDVDDTEEKVNIKLYVDGEKREFTSWSAGEPNYEAFQGFDNAKITLRGDNAENTVGLSSFKAHKAALTDYEVRSEYNAERIGLKEYADTEKFVNNDVISGVARMSADSELQIAFGDSEEFQNVDTVNGSWSYEFDGSLLGTKTIKFRIINSNNAVIAEKQIESEFVPPIELSVSAVSGGIDVEAVNMYKGREVGINAVLMGAAFSGTSVTVLDETMINLPTKGSSDIAEIRQTGDYYKLWAAVNESGIYRIISPIYIFPTETEEDIESGNAMIPQSGAAVYVDVNPDTLIARLDIATSKPKKDVIVEVFAPNGTKEYINAVTTGEDSTAAISYTISNAIEGENYTVKAYCDGVMNPASFCYYRNTTINNSLEELASKPANDVLNDIDSDNPPQYLKVIGFDYSYYNLLTEERKRIALIALAKESGILFDSTADAKNAFNASVEEQTVLQQLSCAEPGSDGENSAGVLIEKWKNKVGYDVEGDYSLLERRKPEFYSNWINNNNCKSYEELKARFEEGALTELLNQYQKYEIVDNKIIELRGSDIGLNSKAINKYTALSYTEKVKTIENWKSDYFTSLTEAKNTFENSIPRKQNPIVDDGGGSPSGSGPKKNFAGEYATITTPVPIPKEEEKETAGSEFKDVSTNHWAYLSIKKLYDEKIVSGVGDSLFEPERSVKREEFVKMLLAACKVEITTQSSDGHWAAPYMETAKNIGVIQGFADGSMGVGQEITRIDMCVMIKRILDAQKKSIMVNQVSKKSFADYNSVPQYGIDALDYLSERGVINGFEDGTFRPTSSVTRAMAAKVIADVLNLSVEVNPDDSKTDSTDSQTDVTFEEEYDEEYEEEEEEEG